MKFDGVTITSGNANARSAYTHDELRQEARSAAKGQGRITSYALNVDKHGNVRLAIVLDKTRQIFRLL